MLFASQTSYDRASMPHDRSGISAESEPSQKPAGPSARSVLRTATDAIHERMHHHAGFASLAGGTISRLAYRQLLARSYGFYVMIEPLLEHGDNWAERLADDLAELGMTREAIADLPRCPQPAIGLSKAARTGAAYVVLGASLGGKVMARAIRSTPGEAALPTRFLDSDGELPWNSFAARLDILLPDERARSTAAGAAVATFSALENWMNGWADHDD